MRRNLRAARSRMHYSQAQMADALNIHERTYRLYEEGIRGENVYIWLKLEDITGMPVRYLMEDDGIWPDNSYARMKRAVLAKRAGGGVKRRASK